MMPSNSSGKQRVSFTAAKESSRKDDESVNSGDKLPPPLTQELYQQVVFLLLNDRHTCLCWKRE